MDVQRYKAETVLFFKKEKCQVFGNSVRNCCIIKEGLKIAQKRLFTLTVFVNVLQGVSREIKYFCPTFRTAGGRDTVDGVGTRYGLDGLVFEARWARDFLCHSRMVR